MYYLSKSGIKNTYFLSSNSKHVEYVNENIKENKENNIFFVLPGKIDPWEGDSDSVTVDCQLINPLNQEIPKHALGNIKH